MKGYVHTDPDEDYHEDEYYEQCGDESDNGNICTRPKDHDGLHMAVLTEAGHGWEDKVLEKWEPTYEGGDVLDGSDDVNMTNTIATVDVNWDAYFGYAEQNDEAVGEVMVSADLLGEFVERIQDEALVPSHSVRLTATRSLPLIAQIEDTEIGLAPRVPRD